MEYWIVFDVASGAELYRGSGTAGASGYQQLPDGAALVVVPQAVVAAADLDLAALRIALANGIDAQAEAVRLRFLTPGTGQALTYQRKEAEASGWLSGATLATPFLTAEATARGIELSEVAAEVLSQADAWITVGAVIEGLRMGAKSAISNAQSFGAIMAAATVAWPS